MSFSIFFFSLPIFSIIFVLYSILEYFTSNTTLRHIPGPFFAKFSNLWLFLQARQGKRYLSVDRAHKKYGKLVRIQPNHVSIADDEAIHHIYGHGNGFLKSEYYEAFVSIQRGIFNTRDRAEHSRRRRNVSHAFSASSVGKFEEHINKNLHLFVKQLDELVEKANGDYAKLDSLHWFNLLTFDIIGDLAFGRSFKMLEKGEDVTEFKLTPDSPPQYTKTVQVLNRRGEVSGTLGCLPQLKPFGKYLPDPFFRQGLVAGDILVGIAVASVSQRLEGKYNPNRVDILSRLMQVQDENGVKLPRDELTSETLTQMIAGSDTTSNTSCAILYWILRTPHVLSKLQAELDTVISNDVVVPSYDLVKELPYLHYVIKETMRLHSSSSIGLPREVPPGPGVTIYSHHFPAGTVLSVPAYTIHHSPEIWGDNADEFLPERWENLTPRQKSAFIPFSYGPRSCIGRNLAMMELALIIATTIHIWDFKLYTENLETREGFLRKPIECIIGIKKRKPRIPTKILE